MNRSHEDRLDSGLPQLPILNQSQPAAPARSQAEKYGAAFYLGIAGLTVLVGVIAWFAWHAWSLRDVWSLIYVLNDPKRSTTDRISAARALAGDARVSQQQRLELCLSRTLPADARFTLAMSLDERVLQSDGAGYARMVARSAGWPAWLRLALARPLAYGTGRFRLPREELSTLARSDDELTSLWACCAIAVEFDDPDAHRALRLAAMRSGPTHAVALRLEKAGRAPAGTDFAREQLDEASRLTAEIVAERQTNAAE